MQSLGEKKQHKKSLLLFIFFLIPAYIIFAQSEREELWISLSADTGLYSTDSAAFGGGFSLGYGTGLSFGVKVSWYNSSEGLETLEMNLILRFYFFGKDSYSGPFLQFMGGPSLFNDEGKLSVPSDSGAFSAGLAAGWRFIFNDRWFVEPAIRGGFPYLFSAGISAGVRF